MGFHLLVIINDFISKTYQANIFLFYFHRRSFWPSLCAPLLKDIPENADDQVTSYSLVSMATTDLIFHWETMNYYMIIL